MAANHDPSSPEQVERFKAWYLDDWTEVNGPIRKLLEEYSKVPSAEVVEHVNTIRERGFKSNPYACIGLYRFANLTLLTHPLYNTILERLQRQNATYLDVGCCFGQDLRQLVQDGVPSQRLIGLDIEGPLMELGYEFFLDRATLQSRFIVADVFKGTAQGNAWRDLEEHGVDVVHCSAFFHLFPLEEQISSAKNITKLVKKGGMIVGRQIGSIKPGDLPAAKKGTFSYRHDVKTLNAMWEKVGEDTQTRWEVKGSLDLVGHNPLKPTNFEDENSRRLLYTVIRLE